MLLYGAVYSLLATVGLTSSGRRIETFWTLFFFGFLLTFMGTRYYVGCDFYGYLVRYENTPPDAEILSALQLNEPLFQALTFTVKVLGLDYMWLNFFSTLLILAGLFYFLRTQPDRILILALLFPVILLQLSMSGIRQGIAVAMLLASTVHWLRGERIRCALFLVFGAQFHSSLYAFLPISLLAGQQISTVRLIVAVILLTPVAGFLLADRLNVYVDRYVTQIYGASTAGGAYIRYAMIFIPIPFFLLMHKRIRARYPERYELMKLFAVIIIALGPLGVWSSVALHRMNFYVMPFSILIFIAAAHVSFLKKQKTLGEVIPILAYGGYMVLWMSTSRHASECYLPYQTYLFN